MTGTVRVRRLLLTGILSSAGALALAAVLSAAERAEPSAGQALAQQILQAAEVKGGFIIHLGCGDGTLTAALRAGDAFLVHGLDADADKVQQARERIQRLGLYGVVSVDRFDGKRLPYVDNLANLVVAERLGGVPVIVAGEGPVVVLIPGLTGDSGIFRYQIPALSCDYRVIAPNLRVDFNGAERTFDQFAHDLARVLEVAGADSACLLGLSFGGPIAMRFATLYPDRVWGLVLTNTLARLDLSHVGLNRTLLIPVARWTSRFLPEPFLEKTVVAPSHGMDAAQNRGAGNGVRVRIVRRLAAYQADVLDCRHRREMPFFRTDSTDNAPVSISRYRIVSIVSSVF